MSEFMRLDRFLAECNRGSRKEVKEMVRHGLITVNGVRVKDSAMKVNPDSDVILLNGEQLRFEKYRYYMLNKPEGCVTANRDGLSKTVMEYLAGEDLRDLFAVGRLDKDTEGLLLITNDGPLGHALLSPKRHVDKTYLAVVDAPLGETDMRTFAEGMDIGDEDITLPAEIRAVAEEEYPELNSRRNPDQMLPLYEVVLREGRFHQVKRMFEAFGSHVMYLKRISMGPIVLDAGLEPGQYRRLTPEEVAMLKEER